MLSRHSLARSGKNKSNNWTGPVCRVSMAQLDSSPNCVCIGGYRSDRFLISTNRLISTNNLINTNRLMSTNHVFAAGKRSCLALESRRTRELSCGEPTVLLDYCVSLYVLLVWSPGQDLVVLEMISELVSTTLLLLLLEYTVLRSRCEQLLSWWTTTTVVVPDILAPGCTVSGLQNLQIELLLLLLQLCWTGVHKPQ